jgi:hypothetical protein
LSGADPSTWGLLADLLVVVHLGIVLYSLLGAVVVLCGWPLRWGWVRNPWFRFSHLAVVVFVAVQAAFDAICPLTTWESELRAKAGQRPEEGSFVGRLAHDLLFVDVPQATLNVIYIAFAALVVGTLIGCPPRRRAPGGAA